MKGSDFVFEWVKDIKIDKDAYILRAENII